MNTRLKSMGKSLPKVVLPGLFAALLLSGCAVYDPYYPAQASYPVAQPVYPVGQPVYPAPVYAAPVYAAPVYVPSATFSLGIFSGGHGGGHGHYRGGGGHFRGGGGHRNH